MKTTLRFALLALLLWISACKQPPPTVGYEGYVIPAALQREIGALRGRSLSRQSLGAEPFAGWELYRHEGFFVGPVGPQAVMQKPGGVVLAFPIRCDADARAYMALFGAESNLEGGGEVGSTSSEFDAMCSRVSLPVRR